MNSPPSLPLINLSSTADLQVHHQLCLGHLLNPSQAGLLARLFLCPRLVEDDHPLLLLEVSLPRQQLPLFFGTDLFRERVHGGDGGVKAMSCGVLVL